MKDMKIFAISLGCAKNSIDTELILGALCAEGRAHVVECEDEADVILINTCGFLESAVQESIDAILQVAQYKRDSQLLSVTGCMVQRYGSDLERALPEVDLFHGARQPERMAEKIIDRFSALDTGSPAHDGENSAHAVKISGISPDALVSGRLVTTPPWRAFVKIAEGCSNRCTYCLIPSIRGPLACRAVDEIVDEIGQLTSRGVREVTLLSQDLTSYRYGQADLAALVKEVVEQTDLPWLRLLYLHPAGITPGLLRIMEENPDRICPYLDIPIQHASSDVLRRMGRGYGAEDLHELFGRIRDALPHAALRTTVMVGFPGETQDDFQRLLSFVERWRFMHLGCFVYSDEEGCSARRFSGKVDREVAEGRKTRIMEVQARISQELNREFVGTRQKVLVEGLSEETELLLAGRTMFQAVEVDGITYIADGTADAGDIVEVEITDSHVYDLAGQIVGA